MELDSQFSAPLDFAICEYCAEEFGEEGDDGISDLQEHRAFCDSQEEPECHTFDPEKVKKELATMIIMHNYPLSIVEQSGFRDFSLFLQPLLKPFLSRDEVRNDILKIYEVEKRKTMDLLKYNPSRIAITAEIWTSPTEQTRQYMTVGAQFNDESWTLRRRILRFIYLPYPNDAGTYSNALMKCLLDWKINSKMSTLIIDTCMADSGMTQIMLEKLSSSTLIMDGKLFNLSCFANMLNSIVKDGLEMIDDPVDGIHGSISYWTETPEKLAMFRKTARGLRIPCTMKLSLDCDTRWDTTYSMLRNALTYKSVFQNLEKRDPKYKRSCCCPEEEEWVLIEEILNKLKLFFHVAKMVSRTKYPTANLLFPQVHQIRLSIREWITSTKSEDIRKMASNMIEKIEKYWNVTQGMLAVATILDPRFKIKLLSASFLRFTEMVLHRK